MSKTLESIINPETKHSRFSMAGIWFFAVVWICFFSQCNHPVIDEVQNKTTKAPSVVGGKELKPSVRVNPDTCPAPVVVEIPRSGSRSSTDGLTPPKVTPLPLKKLKHYSPL